MNIAVEHELGAAMELVAGIHVLLTGNVLDAGQKEASALLSGQVFTQNAKQKQYVKS